MSGCDESEGFIERCLLDPQLVKESGYVLHNLETNELREISDGNLSLATFVDKAVTIAYG